MRSCRLRRTWFARHCGVGACEVEERHDSTVLEFRQDGSLVKRVHRNPDGSEWVTICEYNANRLTTMRTESGSTFASLRIYEYDAVGRLTRVVIRSADGSDRLEEAYEYDSAGRKKKTFYVDAAAVRPDSKYVWGVEGTDTCYSAPGAATLTTLYNQREQPAELLFHDAAGMLLSRVRFSYDADANLIEEIQTNAVDTLPQEVITAMDPAQLEAVHAILGTAGGQVRWTHRYDGKGRRIESRSQIGRLGGEVKKMLYNDYCDRIAEASEHEAREYSIGDQGQLSDTPANNRGNRSEARFQYDYDANGNWVLKIVESRAGTEQEFTQVSVERRTIEYFAPG